MKILIVEDDLASREYLKNAIEIEGHEYKAAENGREGLEIFSEFKPDLVLCDIQMPIMDGLELLEAIRGKKSNSIFIMITAFSTEDYAVKAFHLGANNYIKKPVRQSDLIGLLQKYEAVVKNRKAVAPKVPGNLLHREFVLEFPTHTEMVPKVVDYLIQETGNLFSSDEKISIELGLVELFTNSIEHGNLEISFQEKSEALKNGKLERLYEDRLNDPKLASRKIRVQFEMIGSRCTWIIEDEGKGFDWKDIQSNIEEERLFDLNGRGIFICQFLFDELEYSGRGN
ncbi:MAG: response regulator, partial [Bacteroidales bacterium]|nr:response regulator [Bacteroidales bacterium]